MYVIHNIETRRCNLCSSGKAISITYSEDVFVGLGIQHAMCLHHFVIRGSVQAPQNIFPHYLINGKIFEEKNVIDHKMCVFIFCTTFV